MTAATPDTPRVALAGLLLELAEQAERGTLVAGTAADVRAQVATYRRHDGRFVYAEDLVRGYATARATLEARREQGYAPAHSWPNGAVARYLDRLAWLAEYPGRQQPAWTSPQTPLAPVVQALAAVEDGLALASALRTAAAAAGDIVLTKAPTLGPSKTGPVRRPAAAPSPGRSVYVGTSSPARAQERTTIYGVHTGGSTPT